MISLECRKLLLLSTVLAAGYLVTTVLSTPATLSGLSTVLGTTIVSTALFNVLASFQLYGSLVLIGLLVYSELADPAYGKTKALLHELRTGLMPYVVLLVLIFSLIVTFKVITILSP